MTSLKNAWDIYTAKIKSPQKFLDFGFYYMIGAALQRRVWLGPYLKPIVPNLYIVLCGDPGVGKGLVINDIAAIMKHHKFKISSPEEVKINKMLEKAQKEGATSETILLLQQSREALEQIRTFQKDGKSGRPEEELLFPVGADATTYESLLQQHSNSLRVFRTSPCLMAPSGVYTYHSLCFVIEEASSLFRKHSETLIQYLLAAYNCEDYTYRTKHQGNDIIKRCSLAMLGGTTPDFMKDAFSDKLLGEGFTSRTIFVYGEKNRFESFFIPEYTSEQLACRELILSRLKSLSNIFGQCEHSKDAYSYLEWYFKEIHPKRKQKIDPKLRHYIARKDLHVQKLALCVHFADNDSLVIEQSSFETAIGMLDTLEGTMSLCLNTKSQNPVGEIQRVILKYLKEQGPKMFIEIYMEFVDLADQNQINEALEYLTLIGKVNYDNKIYEAKK